MADRSATQTPPGHALPGAAGAVAPNAPGGPPPPSSGRTAGAPQGPERSLTVVATDGVAYLVYWLVILVLFGQAITSVLRPPDDVQSAGFMAGLVCLVWSTFCLGMGILRGSRPDGADLPPPVWLPVVASAGCLISLSLVRAEAGLAGPWPAELGAAALLVASVTVWRGEWVGGALGLVMGALLLLGPEPWRQDVPSAGSQQTPAVPGSLAEALAGVTLIATGFAVALALVLVRRRAQQLQQTVDARDELLVRERSVEVASQVAAELERSLHDTALNTLETIAAHGEHLDPDLVRARCGSDVDRLSQWRSETGVREFGEVLGRLLGHAENLGLTLEIDMVGPPPGSAEAVAVPAPVLQAISGAATEALTNVTKHAGVSRATILVLSGHSSLQVLVGDEGVGPSAPSGGFGVESSVSERMAAVGGTALLSAGPGGRGTVVALAWQPEPEELPRLGADLLARVAGVVVSVATLLAGVACALVVLDWSAYAYPWPALVAPLLPVLAAAAVLNRALANSVVGPAYVLAACATYLAVGAAAVVADPTCSAALGEGVLLDERLALVVVVLLLAPRPGVLAALLGTVVLAHLGGALAWSLQGQGCGPSTATLGVYVVAALAAVWLFARWIERAAAAYGRARSESARAEIRIRSAIAVRAEEELWVADTLASAQALLGSIAEGLRDPAQADTRAACAAEASSLRALLAVGRAPDRLRRSARIWLRLLSAAGCTVQVRGSFAGCSPPSTVVGHVGGVLDTFCALAPGAAVTLSAWGDGTSGSMTVMASGAAVEHAGGALESRVHRVAGEVAWLDYAPDSLTVEWAWQGP
jgi:hypothetical protein